MKPDRESEIKNAYRSVQQSLERAMREAAWEFTSRFRDVPELRPWIEAHGVKAANR